MATLYSYSDTPMSVEIKTRALLLRRYPFRERSWILHLHTEKEGTLSVLATGKKSLIMLPGAIVYATLRVRPQREVQRLVEIDWAYLYRRFYHEPERTFYLLLAVEWLSQCLRAPEPALFEWVVHQLIALDATQAPQEELRIFLTDLFRRLGGNPLSPALPLGEIEAAYAEMIPGWKPIRTLSLPIFGAYERS